MAVNEIIGFLTIILIQPWPCQNDLDILPVFDDCRHCGYQDQRPLEPAQRAEMQNAIPRRGEWFVRQFTNRRPCDSIRHDRNTIRCDEALKEVAQRLSQYSHVRHPPEDLLHIHLHEERTLVVPRSEI